MVVFYFYLDLLVLERLGLDFFKKHYHPSEINLGRLCSWALTLCEQHVGL